jgi:hypothetical protein
MLTFHKVHVLECAIPIHKFTQVNLEVDIDKILREVKFLLYLTEHSITSKIRKQEQYLREFRLLLWVLMPTLLS